MPMMAEWKQIQAADGVLAMQLTVTSREGIQVAILIDPTFAQGFLREGLDLADASAAGILLVDAQQSKSRRAVDEETVRSLIVKGRSG